MVTSLSRAAGAGTGRSRDNGRPRSGPARGPARGTRSPRGRSRAAAAAGPVTGILALAGYVTPTRSRGQAGERRSQPDADLHILGAVSQAGVDTGTGYRGSGFSFGPVAGAGSRLRRLPGNRSSATGVTVSQRLAGRHQ